MRVGNEVLKGSVGVNNYLSEMIGQEGVTRGKGINYVEINEREQVRVR